MSKEIQGFETWEDVILDFFEQKMEAEEEKFLKEVIKLAGEQYKENKFFNNPDIKYFFDPKKNKKEKNQHTLEFQRIKFKHLIKFTQKPNKFDRTALEKKYYTRCQEIRKKFTPHIWIEKASKGATSVSFATHVAKLTHSQINSPSLFDQIHTQKSRLLTTSSLREKVIDGAVAGNQFAPVFQFLELQLKGIKMATCFVDETNSILNYFTKDQEELKLWNTGFKQALSSRRLSSHSLAKQIYFPITSHNPLLPESYHLLCHVKSSSLAHAIFLKMSDIKQVNIQNQKKKNKFSLRQTIFFPQKACVMATASNHSNASQLNGKRGGRLQLFTSGPPTWHSQLKLPTTKWAFFSAGLAAEIKETMDYLRDFLVRFQMINLSIKDPRRKKWIDAWLTQIVDKVMTFAIGIQNMPAGWSKTENHKLEPAYQYFLDPYRSDEQFQQARQNADWQKVICADFAIWLNSRLTGKEKKFSPQAEHTQIWKERMAEELREYNQDISGDINAQNREAQA